MENDIYLLSSFVKLRDRVFHISRRSSTGRACKCRVDTTPSGTEEPRVVESILRHIGEPTQAPTILPARAPPQAEMDFDQSAGHQEWPDMDQTAGMTDDTWN